MDDLMTKMLIKVATPFLKGAEVKLHTGMDKNNIKSILIDVNRESDFVVITVKKSDLPTEQINIKKNEMEKILKLL